MASADVCAVIYAAAPAPDVLSAVEAQTFQPQLVLADPVTLALAVRAASSSQTRWLWVLDGYAVPEPGALGAMLAASEITAPPAPVLLASKVVDRHGRLHPDSTPRHEILANERSVDAAERHLVQLRAAAPGSVLVDRAAIDQVEPPRPDLPSGLEMREWSARMLRSPARTGYLVPASVAVRPLPPDPMSWRDFQARARLLGSSAWSPREKLREAFLLTREAAGAIRR